MPLFRLIPRVVPSAALYLAVSIFGLFIAVHPAAALTPQEEAAQTADRIQREQQERQQQQRLEDAARRHETAPIKLPEVAPPSLFGATGCRDIRKIELAGVTLLTEKTKEKLVAPFLNRCLTARDIEKLMSEILKAYIDRGYIAVRPYIRAQDLTGGTLEIVIVEGEVEMILLEDGGKGSVNIAGAFPFVVGKPLNLRDIEQGLEQVNRLASNGATMQVSPGAGAGDSVIQIVNKPVLPIGIALTMDNQGSHSTGKSEVGGTVNFDRPLHLNDFITYTHRESVLEDRDKKLSKMDSGFYSIPFGYTLFSFSYNHSDYLTVINPSGVSITTSGTNESYTGRLDWVAYRDQIQKLDAAASFTYKSTKNYLDGNLLQVSSRDLAVLDLDLNGNGTLSGFVVNAGFGFSQGLAVFGAQKDPDGIPSDAPHAQGSKYRYSAGIMCPFALGSLPATLSSQVSGQYAPTALYGSEQIVVGSFYTVRGFDRNSLSGDRGHFMRNEFTVTLPDFPLKGVFLKPFVGLDAGRIEQFSSTPAANLVGCAAGLRLGGKYLSGELSVAQPLAGPSGMGLEAAQVNASLAITF